MRETDTRLLVIKEIFGGLSPSDREILYAKIKEDKAFSEERDQLMREFQNEKDFVTAMPAVDPADVILVKGDERRAKRNRSKRIVMTVCSAAASVLVLLMFVNRRPPGSLEKEVRLTLPGGEVVSLAKDVNQRFGNVQVVNSGNRLSYSGGGDQYATVIVPAGKGHVVVFPDGTSVQLNAGTTVRFKLGFRERDVFINGEAYVDVAKDAERPFLVHVPRADVRVLGTAFNVNSYDEAHAKVALVEGKVQVIGGSDSVYLLPGEESVVSKEEQVKHVFDRDEVLSWRAGKYVVNNMTLEDACEGVSRWYGQPIVVDDTTLRQRRVSGEVDKAQPLEVFMRAMKAALEVDYYLDEKGVYHVKK